MARGVKKQRKNHGTRRQKNAARFTRSGAVITHLQNRNRRNSSGHRK
jgi:hypothetical protein